MDKYILIGAALGVLLVIALYQLAMARHRQHQALVDRLFRECKRD